MSPYYIYSIIFRVFPQFPSVIFKNESSIKLTNKTSGSNGSKNCPTVHPTDPTDPALSQLCSSAASHLRQVVEYRGGFSSQVLSSVSYDTKHHVILLWRLNQAGFRPGMLLLKQQPVGSTLQLIHSPHRFRV